MPSPQGGMARPMAVRAQSAGPSAIVAQPQSQGPQAVPASGQRRTVQSSSISSVGSTVTQGSVDSRTLDERMSDLEKRALGGLFSPALSGHGGSLNSSTAPKSREPPKPQSRNKQGADSASRGSESDNNRSVHAQKKAAVDNMARQAQVTSKLSKAERGALLKSKELKKSKQSAPRAAAAGGEKRQLADKRESPPNVQPQ